jgi:hypothetical protein
MMISRPSSKLPEIQTPVCSRLASMLRCVSIAPFETPVVPPVYCRKARSSGVTPTGAKGASAPRASASSREMAASIRQGGTIFRTVLTTKFTSQRLGIGSRSPICVVITCSTGVSCQTFSSVAAKFSTTTMARAPESRNWCASSFAVYIGFTFTTVMPARRMPKSTTGYCSTFGDMMATRSPLPIPGRVCRKAAKSRDSFSSSE